MIGSSQLATVALSFVLLGSGVRAVATQPDANSILDDWERRYVATSELDLYLRSTIAGPLPTVVYADTRIRFRAPSRWAIEMENGVGGRAEFLATGEELIRRAGKPGKVASEVRFEDIHRFLASVVGVSVGGFGNAAALVVQMVEPSGLFASENLVIRKASATRLPDERVRDRDCFVVGGKEPGSNYDVRLWIDRESFDLHRYSVAQGRQVIVVELQKKDPDDATALRSPTASAAAT